MVSRIKGNSPASPRRPPGTTPDARENQLIAAAVDSAERQILDGTAPAQLVIHYLKLGSSREKLEQHRLRLEGELLEAKATMMASQKNSEDLYAKALQAMRSYSGDESSDEEEQL